MGMIHASSWQAAYPGLLPPDQQANITMAERLARFNEIFPVGSDQILVAEIDGVVIGWVAFGASRDDDRGGGAGEVYSLYISPQRWRQGAGAALWQEACEGLAKTGYSNADVWVLETNDRARRFYEAMGCELDITARKMFESGGQAIPEVRYSVTLN